MEYYRGLIELRQQLPGLQDKTADAHLRVLDVCQLTQDAAAIRLDNGKESPWTELLMCFNASRQEVTLNLPQGSWAILADGESSLKWQNPQAITGQAILPPMTTLILGKT